jgi:uncharacterized protein YbjT (DUF2867 family)
MNTKLKINNVNDEVILVLGGAGKTGGRVTERLEAMGRNVRSASRSSTPRFDWNDEQTWDAVFDGVTSAYVAYSPDLAVPGATKIIQALTNKAVALGVQRLVLLSGRGEPEAQRCEQIIQNAGVDSTVVRASWFNQNFSEGEFLGLVQSGAITVPAAGVSEPFVDVDDIADVAVAALTESGHDGEIYEVTGPRLMSFAEVADELSIAADRNIEFIPIPKDVFLVGAQEAGANEEMIWLMDYLFETILDGRNAYVSDGVQRALGREPRDFADYARAAAASGVWKVAA